MGWREGVFQMPARNGPGLEAEHQLPLGGASWLHFGREVCGAMARQGSSWSAMWHCCYC